MIAIAGRRMLYVLVLACGSIAGQNGMVPDGDISVLRFENLTYPLAARLKHIQGVVVVRVGVDVNGRVTTATAISGAEDLVPDCISNAKKWRFQRASHGRAVLVYHFKIRGLCNLPCPSHFTFEPPNIVIVATGDPVVDHSAEN